MRQRILLGPQRPVTNLGDVVAKAGLGDGPVAVISAGWQEAEGDIEDVHALVNRPLVDLELYHRADRIFAADDKLHSAYRERQELLKDLQRLYRVRLRHHMLAARQLQKSDANTNLLATEQRHAISQLRALDRHHFNRVEAIHARFDDAISIDSSAILAENQAEIEKILHSCETVLLTGGNVVVLLNRLRLFRLPGLLASKNLVAWSAGAMVLSEKVVLYHDRTPQGRRDPEVLGRGAGVLPGCIFLPDAGRRLRTKDAVRIELFCRRFAPVTSLTLDSGEMLRFDGEKLAAAEGVKRLSRSGKLIRIRTA